MINFNLDKKDTVIIIGKDVVIDGSRIFERTVKPYVHITAEVNKISGAKTVRYSEDEAVSLINDLFAK